MHIHLTVLVASLADDFEWLHLFELLQIYVLVALSLLELILVVVHIEKLLAFAELNLEKLFVAWVDPMLPRLELRVLALVLEHCLDSIPPPLIGDPVPELEQVGDLFDHLSLQSWGTLCEQECTDSLFFSYGEAQNGFSGTCPGFKALHWRSPCALDTCREKFLP